MIGEFDGTPLRALGAMSGTSLDGVDAAVIETDGIAISGFGETRYRAYSDAERAVLRAGLGHWDGPEVAAAARVVEDAHLDLIAGMDCDVAGFHGQTLAHAPGTRGTLQAGDGAALARALGLPVVWDFRTRDVAEGGQGAPLAPFFHFACARRIGARAPIGFLNLGGVGNLTWIDPSCSAPETPGALLAFDTGPANAPLDDLMQARRGLTRDENGALAASGTVDHSRVARFLDHPYFAAIPPKSLDRGDFAHAGALVSDLDDADAAATLTAMSAAAVAQAMIHCPATPERVLVTGGGRRNPRMMAELAQRLTCPVAPVEAAGLDGDMLEAQAFAYLAVRVLRGLPTSATGTTGVPHPVCGGRISAPDAAGSRG